jgi:hypothetical protein
VVRLSLDTSRLISEGLQRRDELRKFLSVLEDPRVQLATVEGASHQLAGNERVLTETIGAGRCFPDVCETLGFDRESAARIIQLLRLVGAVKLVPAPTASPTGSAIASVASSTRPRGDFPPYSPGSSPPPSPAWIPSY